jgi:hypothetical protein
MSIVAFISVGAWVLFRRLQQSKLQVQPISSSVGSMLPMHGNSSAAPMPVILHSPPMATAVPIGNNNMPMGSVPAAYSTALPVQVHAYQPQLQNYASQQHGSPSTAIQYGSQPTPVPTSTFGSQQFGGQPIAIQSYPSTTYGSQPYGSMPAAVSAYNAQPYGSQLSAVPSHGAQSYASVPPVHAINNAPPSGLSATVVTATAVAAPALPPTAGLVHQQSDMFGGYNTNNDPNLYRT